MGTEVGGIYFPLTLVVFSETTTKTTAILTLDLLCGAKCGKMRLTTELNEVK